MFGDDFRFWAPLTVLAIFGGYSGQKLVRTHIDADVNPNNYTLTKTIPARRGTIFDATGHAMAQSIPLWDYHLDPVALTNRVIKGKDKRPLTREQIVKTIADALGKDYDRILKMSGDVRKRYQDLGLSADDEAHAILADSKKVAGVSIEERHVRKYLDRRRMAHILGAVNAEHVGSAGLEQKYNRWLTGFPGEIKGMKDARGHELYDRRVVSVAPVAGADIHLTVDCNLQYEAETALETGVKEFGAGSGWCIVMDAHSAAVLAMASLPDFDPVLFGSASDRAKVNRACSFTYEPGSVMKVITASAGIDCGRVRPTTMISTDRNDQRYYKLPGDGSHVWEPYMSIADAIVHSSNIVIGKLGYDLTPPVLYRYMRAFGFGQKTGLELPGEETGILPLPAKWDKASWSRAPIGQFLTVTALQLCSAYQAIANDGRRMKPHLVDRIVASDGTTLYEHTDEELGRPITAATARTMRNVMLGVASKEGTARRAAIRGYSVAGKTGTAQVSAGKRGYIPGLYRATFCGIVPASDPRLVILVTLDFDEKRKFHQGGNSAGPVFKRLATGALRYLMVPPDRPNELEEFSDDDEFDRMMDERAHDSEDL